MNAILDLLATLSPAIQTFTLLALVVYVWKTWQMAKATSAAANASEGSLREMRLSREQQIQPYVICHFHDIPSSKSFELVIANIGATMAFDVEIAFEPQLQDYNPGHPARTLAKKTFKALAPQYHWRSLWGSFIGMDEAAVPDEFTAHVSYRWGRNRRHEEYDLSFDLKSLMGKRYFQLPPTAEESLAVIAAKLTDLATGLSHRTSSDDA